MICERGESNPHGDCPPEPKSDASANFATFARIFVILCNKDKERYRVIQVIFLLPYTFLLLYFPCRVYLIYKTPS